MTEKDPNGKGFGEGAKKDEGKPRIGLVLEAFPDAIAAIAAVLDHGCKEYGRGSWRKVENAVERYQDAGYRHSIAIHKGEITDSKTGLLHAAHKAWNALAELQLCIEASVKPKEPEKPKYHYFPCVVAEYKVCDNCGECK